MALYQLTDSDTVIRVEDGACIPSDQKNTNYREYLDWVAGGGVPDPYVAPPPPDALDAFDIIALKICFNHENRIRTLEGRQAVTLAQFRTAIKALL